MQDRMPRRLADVELRQVGPEFMVWRDWGKKALAVERVQARVLQLCDGRTSRAEAAASLERELGCADGPAVLEEALESLRAEELLTPELLPVGRGSHVLATEVGDEVLLYETRLRRAVRLDPVAARVWTMCDGRTTVAEAVRRIAEDSGLPAEGAEDLLWHVLGRLRDEKLLLVRLPQGSTRRELLSRWGKLIAAVPLVAAAMAPTPAQAASLPNCVTGFHAGCQATFGGAGARIPICIECTLGGPCTGAALRCMTAYNQTGTSCLDDAVLGIFCTNPDGGDLQDNCVAARADAATGYSCCQCP